MDASLHLPRRFGPGLGLNREGSRSHVLPIIQFPRPSASPTPLGLLLPCFCFFRLTLCGLHSWRAEGVFGGSEILTYMPKVTQ